jgi:DNA repair exonuclease SbcCD ATPase subunit
MTARILVTAAAALMLAPFDADAQSYRCVGKDGKRYYGSVVPTECLGQPVEELSPQGMVVRRLDPEGSEKERLAKEANEAKKREESAAAKEAARRTRALMATYTSERDIEEARARALAENQKALKDLEGRIEAIRNRQSDYEKELEFYKGKNKPPAKLTEDIKSAADDLKLQQDALAAKKREVESINAKYDEDKKRYAAMNNNKR